MVKFILWFFQILLLVSICTSPTGCVDKEEPVPEVAPAPEPGKKASGWGPSTTQTRDAYETRDGSTGQDTEDDIYTVTGTEEMRGDCDGDGEITTSDALCALQMAVGRSTEDLIMDINGDGRISSLDARKVLRNALGLEVLK